MLIAQPLENGCPPDGYIGGLKAVKAVFVEDVALVQEMEDDVRYADITLRSGVSWANVAFEAETAFLRVNEVESDQGLHYDSIVEGIQLSDLLSRSQVLRKYNNRDILLECTDLAGNIRLVGTPFQPCSLTKQYDGKAAFNETPLYSLRFQSLSNNPPLFRNGTVIEVDPTPPPTSTPTMTRKTAVATSDGQTAYTVTGLPTALGYTTTQIFYKTGYLEDNEWAPNSNGFTYAGSDYPQTGDKFYIFYFPTL